MTVDIGQNKDWSISDFKEDRHTTIDGKEYIEHILNKLQNNTTVISRFARPLKYPHKRMDLNIYSKTYPNSNKQLCWHRLTQ